MENAQLQQDKYELASLRELYDIDKATSDYEKMGARVIASDSSNWFYSFTIDKGSDDGIQVDMNVLAGSGLAAGLSASAPIMQGCFRLSLIIPIFMEPYFPPPLT